MIRTIVVDDQELVRTGFRMILETGSDIEVVAEAADGRAAIDAARAHTADVILMDIRMPDIDGLVATAAILEQVDPPPAVLILTTFDADDYVYRALRVGASGFLLKDTPPEELIRAVRIVAGGDALLAPSVTRRLIERFAEVARPTDAPELERLSERELEILTLVARGLSNAEIAERLVVGTATVKTHVSNVLAKIGARDRVQAVVFAYEHGVVRS